MTQARTMAKPIALISILVILAIIVLQAQMAPQPLTQVEREGAEGELGENEALPPALSAHLEALSRTLPDNQGMAEEGPGGAAEAAFMARAYPADTISVGQMDRAMTAFTKMNNRPFPQGKARPGEWQAIGPDQALYPFEELRTSGLYVPNAYIAGGRTTDSALAETCVPGDCLLYIAAAGGGVWRTMDALSANVRWRYLGGPLGINATGTVEIDPNDPTGKTVYVGTGEANICGSGCVAGTGIYKSTDRGRTWSGPIGEAQFAGKGVGEILIVDGDPDTMYVASTTALRGMSSVCCSGVTRPVPGAAKWGLYKTTDGGATWAFIHNGSVNVTDCTGTIPEFLNTGICSPRGVRDIAFDPNDTDTIYASSYARGIWRSTDAGATWVQIKPSLNAAVIQTRAAIAVTELPNGATRMYVHEGNAGQNYSRLFRSDSVSTGAPVFADLTSANVADPGWGTWGLCDPQCWYDIFIYTPPGHPDMVYVGGDYSYGQSIANKRGVVLSLDAGVSATDMTMDGTDPIHPNALHPDQHSLVTVPGNPFQFIETGDGGIMRSSGVLVDRSAWCASRGLAAPELARCQQMLSAIPSQLDSLNEGLSTLQFQSLSVSHFDPNELQGGTQDNGTWENYGGVSVWENTMIGDGGQSGFDVAIPEFRFHTFTGAAIDVNFDNGELSKWIWVGGPLGQAAEFYSPVISDPVVSKTMFAGTQTVFRTKTAGLGTRTIAEAQAVCNEWTGTGPFNTCGDWVELGAPRLTNALLGDRAGGNMTSIERTADDTSSGWAATSTGRVFITKNVDAEPASAVTWTRIDDDAVTPNRYVSSIFVDPEDGNHAWISYNGFSVNAAGGHLYEVTFNPASGTATWVDRSYDWGDLPMTDVAVDTETGDVYASSDFGVSMLPHGTTSWVLAAGGMPNVEVTGLTILADERILYAATHGLSAWKLTLP